MKFFLLLLLFIPNLSISQILTKQSQDGKMPMSIDSGLVRIDNTLILIGGSPFFSKFTSAIWHSTNEGETWIEITKQASFGNRSLFAITVHNKDIYIIGGEGLNRDNKLVLYNDIWKSADKGKTWIQINQNPPFRTLAGAKLLTINNDMYLIGGMIRVNVSMYSHYYYSNDVWKSSDFGKTWRKISSDIDIFSGRSMLGAFYHNKKIYVIGGIGFNNKKIIFYNDIWVSKDLGCTWKIITKKAQFPAGVRAYINVNGRFFAVYGHGNKKNPTYLHHDIWESNNLGKTWSKVEHSMVPRGEFSIIPTTNGFILFGGYDNDTAPFDPNSKVWRRDTYKYSITN